MKSIHSLLLATIGMHALLSPLRGSEAAISIQNDPVAIVKAACDGAATTGRIVPAGRTGRTVVVLEETHDSVAGQLELAVVLVRLHAAGVTDLVLEGYLKDNVSGAPLKPVSRDWFRKSAGSLPADVQRETAARLLKEGEISAAEFIFLGYDDVRLFPAETPEVRGSQYNTNHSAAASKAILSIADAVLKAAVASERIDISRFNELATRLKNATGNDAKKEAVRSLMDYVITLDSWLKSAYGMLTDPDLAAKAPLREQARLHKELIIQGRKWNVSVDTKLLEEAAKFFDDRARADDLMIASATATTSKVVALNIGALHTSAIVNSLAAQGLGVVVVTPMSREDNKGKLTNSQFDRKERKQSVFDDGQIARLLKTLPTAPLHARKKPEPSITEPFCQAKGELYNFVSRLTRHILGPPRPPDGGKPPYGFADDAFRGSFFFIDPHRVRYLDKDKAIVFPIARKDEPAMPIVWVKSTKSDMETAPASSLAQSGIALSATADADRLVALLLAHRDTIKAREKAPTSEADRNLAGGTVDIIQVDLKTVAAVGFDEQAVATAVVALR